MATPQQPLTPPPRPQLNFFTALSESKRIINAHSRHFLALSVLFLLPLSFSVVVYPAIKQQLLNPDRQPNSKTSLSYTSPLLFKYQEQPPINLSTKFIVLFLLYSMFVFIFSLFAVGSITYSVYHGFYGRPVKLLSAIKSSVVSFWPLLATTIACQFIFYGILIVFGLFLFSVAKGIEFMGFPISYSSPYFIVAVLAVLVLVTFHFQANWALVSVVAVVESSWGCKPLKRSTTLMKGMKTVAIFSLLFFGFFAVNLEYISMVWVSKMSGASGGDGWKWAFILQIVMTSTLFVLLMLYNLAVNTVLYMYCKAINGELAMEIAEEFAREYVSLPFDDGKVPHVVSVAYT